MIPRMWYLSAAAAAAIRTLPTARLLGVVAAIAPMLATAQEPEREIPALRAPEAWNPIRSLGQPDRIHKFATIGYGTDRFTRPLGLGVTVSAGVSRAVGNPVVGALAIGGEAYAGQRGAQADGGLRANLFSPALRVHGGIDWNARLDRMDVALGLTTPVRRGGWPWRGTQVRLHWLPTRDHSTTVGLHLPIGQPLAGRTRPHRVAAPLPHLPAGGEPTAAPTDAAVRAALRETRVHMTQLASMLTFFWLIENRPLRQATIVREWRETLADFEAEFLSTGEPGRSQYQREADAYHAALERTFMLAAHDGADGAEFSYRERELARVARQVAMEEVVLPYNRTIGRLRQPNSLHGLSARARARYASWLQLGEHVDPHRMTEVLGVFDVWLGDLEGLRARIGRNVPDPRMHWLPMGLVLRPEEHRTQEQIDDLLALALGTPFESGHGVHTIDAPQFQHELRRTIRETQRLHALWIHDYRGRDDAGKPDRTSLETTLTYLRALRDGARGYDASGRFPTYLILLDQYFYEVNDGRLWMTLLEQPLTHRVVLGAEFAHQEAAIVALQDSLRRAVADSRRLQAEARALGPSWLEGLVKVHVNITNPADFTFRSGRIIGLWMGQDNMIRDHRKLILRDPDEGDPGAGELVLAGVGVGDHYATPTWDDRAMIVQGPGTVATLAYMRAALERNGLSGATLPPALRAGVPSPGRMEQIEALERSGATARFLQVHNRTGWADKDATFAQMLLYDLVPAGTLLFVPDGLWTSYQWMAQLVGAALRGCHVYIVAPARDNAPSADFPQMSVMQELLTRLVLVEEMLGRAIRDGGGDLRVGLFARTVPLDDQAASLSDVVRAWDRHEFLRALLPMTADAREELLVARARLDSVARGTPAIQDARERLPMLHRKTQWVIGVQALQALGVAAVIPALIGGDASGPIKEHEPTARLQASPELEPVRALERLRGDGDSLSVLYFMTGSINKNVRSMALDAEVLGIVSGPWAVESMADLVLLAGTVSWLDSLDALEEKLPPYGRWQKLVGRRLHRIL